MMTDWMLVALLLGSGPVAGGRDVSIQVATSTTCPPGKCVIHNSCQPCPTTATTLPVTEPPPRPPSTPVPHPTSTTLPEFTEAHPVRFDFKDVGLAYYASSDDINYDPRDGSWANQYVKMTRIEYAQFVVQPMVVDLMVELGMQPISPNTLQDNVGKFIFGYGCRYIRCDATNEPGVGGQYVWRSNYLVDRWRHLLESVGSVVKKNAALALVTGNPWTAKGEAAAATRPWLAPLMGIGVTATPRQSKLDKTHENEGELDGSRIFAPLNVTQCAALATATAAHDASTNVAATQLAFEATARNVYEQALFSHQFPSGTNADKTPARIADLTAKKHASYHQWAASFGCATHTAPLTKQVIKTKWRHVRIHLLKALPEGYYLRVPCDQYIDECPITSD